MIANASSSSVTSRPDSPANLPPANLLEVDLVAARLLPPLATAWLAGRDLDLLEPLRFLGSGTPPVEPAWPIC